MYYEGYGTELGPTKLRKRCWKGRERGWFDV